MKTLGIDFGASFIDVVVVDGKKILFKQSVEKKKFKQSFFKQLPKVDRVVSTGGKPRKDFLYLNEFDCLGQGALRLSGLKSAVVVSCGTGTAVVWAKKNQPAVHLGGTGVGGGTIQGLGKLLLKTKSVEEILRLAKNGNRTKVDLTVKDILGKGIGLMPPGATAANFGKLASKKKTDLAQSLVGMVAETIGMVACLAAQKTGEKKIVFVGRVGTNKLIQKYLQQVCNLFKLKAIFPQDAEHATAIGAGLDKRLCGGGSE